MIVRKLDPLHGCRIAVLIAVDNGIRVLCGVAHYEVDVDLGPVLRVVIERANNLSLLIPETIEDLSWSNGAEYECDYQIRLEKPTSHPT